MPSTDYDAEDLQFNFKSGKAPVRTYAQTESYHMGGRVPDEFHNT